MAFGDTILTEMSTDCPGATKAGRLTADGAESELPELNINWKFVFQLHEPEFNNRQVFVKLSPPLRTAPSGMLTSPRNVAL
jgi:hypothetical protein